jgi:hypothetical protein
MATLPPVKRFHYVNESLQPGPRTVAVGRRVLALRAASLQCNSSWSIL